VRRRSEKYVVEGSKYAHWIGLYLSFHLNWVLGPFVQGRVQNLQTSEVTFVHVITPLIMPNTGTWLSYLVDLLSLRLVGGVETRINVRDSYGECSM